MNLYLPIDTLMYGVGQLFLLPVLFVIALFFLYAFFALGAFAWQARQRKCGIASNPLNPYSHDKITVIRNAGQPDMEIITRDGQKIELLRVYRLLNARNAERPQRGLSDLLH